MSNQEVVVIARIYPNPEAFDQVVEIIGNNIPTVHAEEGCITYALQHMDATDDGPATLLFVERWSSRDALAAHAGSAHMAATNEKLADLLYRPADVWTGVDLPFGTPAQGLF